MNFQVNDQTYFLSLAEDERKWEVFVSTEDGVRSIPVYVDVPESEARFVVQEQKQRIPN